MIVALVLLGLLYGYLRSELSQRPDDEGAGRKKKRKK